jgi:hypothetical protein
MTTTTPTRKKRRIFMWVFLAVQVLYLVWIIGGASAAGSSASCNGLDAQTCHDATAVGTGLGVAMIVMLWFFTDLFLGIAYAVYRLARRPGA